MYQNGLYSHALFAGRVAEGTERFLRVLEQAPQDVPALYSLATSTPHKFDPGVVDRMKELVGNPAVPPNDRELLHFSLAHVLDRRIAVAQPLA